MQSHENLFHQSLKCGRGVSQAKHHNFLFIQSPCCCKCRFLLILRVHLHLPESRGKIQSRKPQTREASSEPSILGSGYNFLWCFYLIIWNLFRPRQCCPFTKTTRAAHRLFGGTIVATEQKSCELYSLTCENLPGCNSLISVFSVSGSQAVTCAFPLTKIISRCGFQQLQHLQYSTDSTTFNGIRDATTSITTFIDGNKYSCESVICKVSSG